MLKPFLTICLWAALLCWGGAQVYSEDLEDHFIDPDFDTSKSIFIDVKDVSLLNVLKIFSKQTGLSFIANHDVGDRKITLYLNKVPLNQALQMVLDANNLTYEMLQDSNVFVIKEKLVTEKTRITKVFQLKYATVSSSKLNSTIGADGGKSSAGVASGGLEEVLKDSLSPVGKVVEDARTNSLIITDVASQFDIIQNTIAKLDVPIPQILIEVEMLDVSKSTGDQIGIAYGGNGALSFTPLTFTGGIKPSGWPFGPGGLSSTSGSSSGSSSTSGSSSSSSSTQTGFNANGMTAAMNFFANQTDAKTLARPRILTLNNQTAQIEISTDQAVSVEQSSSSTSGSGSTVTGNTVERYTTGVILKVTPQANMLTREVTMAVSPKVVNVSQSLIGTSIYDPQTSGSDSILELRDGQTMVIGGLMRTDNNKSVTKLPFLGDLPLIGGAFRNTSKSKDERELVIFLTPHIIDDTDQTALRGASPSNAAQAALDVQDAADRAQSINNSLNNFDSK